MGSLVIVTNVRVLLKEAGLDGPQRLSVMVLLGLGAAYLVIAARRRGQAETAATQTPAA